MKQDSILNEMRKGLLVLAVLQLLHHSPLYTAEMLKRLNNTEFKTQEGTLYPLLSRLKRQGLIDHEWVESKSGPPRKYYRLSDAGKIHADMLATYIGRLHSQLDELGRKDAK